MLASIESSQAEALRRLGRWQEAESSAHRACESALAVARQLAEVDWDAWGRRPNALGLATGLELWSLRRRPGKLY